MIHHGPPLRHGNLRRIALEGLRHGANAFRPHRDCAETLAQVVAMQRPFFTKEPSPIDVRVYSLAWVKGWETARASERA